MLPSDSLINQYRDRTFYTSPANRLKTIQQAIHFVEERGFVFFWPIKGIVMPSLWCAVAGNRPVPDEHDDPGHVSWSWKDQLLDKRVWYYARVLKKRNTIISLNLIPNFYALSPNFGEPHDEIKDQYRQGLIPVEVKQVFETLLEKGPLDSIALRREAHLAGSNSTSPFNRALDLLQRDLKVLPVAIAEVGSWRYAFVYELTHRYYPDLLEKSRYITEKEARQNLLISYFKSLGMATLRNVRSLFGWDAGQSIISLGALVDSGFLVKDTSDEPSDQTVFHLADMAN